MFIGSESIFMYPQPMHFYCSFLQLLLQVCMHVCISQLITFSQFVCIWIILFCTFVNVYSYTCTYYYDIDSTLTDKGYRGSLRLGHYSQFLQSSLTLA